MVNPKKIHWWAQRLQVHRKKAQMDRAALTASSVAVAEKSHLRKAFPGDGCREDVFGGAGDWDPSREPWLAVGQGREG